MKKRVLLVEDEHGMVVMLRDRLTSAGYEAVVASSGPAGLVQAQHQAFDIILLDILLLGSDGLTVCREIRRRGIATPILMLTALGEVVDRVAGLRTGADDYLVKPFEMMELMARIEALLRRAGPTDRGVVVAADPYRFGEVEVRFRQVEVLRAGEPVHLAPRMFELLSFFVQHRGETLSRTEILDGVWSLEATPGGAHRRCSRGLAAPAFGSPAGASPVLFDGARLRLSLRGLR